MAVSLGSSHMCPSPFAAAELQAETPRAVPQPQRRPSVLPAHETLRSIDFRSLAPKRCTAVTPAPQQAQAQARRAASCAVLPRAQQPAPAPRTVSAGAAALPAVPAPPASARTADSALAWAAGFSRLATALGCAAPAPSGSLWDPPESSDILALLTLELRYACAFRLHAVVYGDSSWQELCQQ